MIRRAAREERRRSPGGIVISIALHALLIAALAQITFGNYALEIFFDRERPAMEERIEYVALPEASSDATTQRPGGNGRPIPVEPPVETPPLVAPSATPTTLPPADTGTARPAAGGEGRGPLVGGGGPLRGLQPAFRDPRIWAPPGALPDVPRTMRQRVDSSIVATVEQYVDSMAALPVEREAGDWTFERDGKKWGIDRQYIRLGDISIPTAVLAVLPLNVQGNPVAIERERALNQQRADILYHADRAVVLDEIKSARERIRKRVEAEREARQRANQRGPVRPPDPKP